jgi:hypothetical protein
MLANTSAAVMLASVKTHKNQATLVTRVLHVQCIARAVHCINNVSLY